MMKKLLPQIERQGVILVDFYQNDCRYCEMLAPQLRILEDEAGISVLSVNLSERSEEDRKFFVDTLGLMSAPTVVIFKGGQEVDRFTGFMPTAAIEARVSAI